ncbi:hypothetical protein [Paenibacillus periandrae]|uniref:hypothetical protein n=1 Tax=Paenibacillus periandrae TaxID=1761741 RepID=UPI001F09D529|nr:hypothetical protein [Paenibacillus periandrae]
MAKPKSIRHMLRNQSHWNPFSDKYDVNKISDELETYLEAWKQDNGKDQDPDDLYALTIVKNGPLFHQYFKQLYEYMRDAIDRTKAHPEQIMKYLVAMGNSDTILLNEHLNETLLRDFDSIRLEEIADIQFEPGNGLPPLHAIGAFEMQVDLLTSLLNYLRYFLHTKELHSHYDEEQLEQISSYLYSSSNVMFAVKDSYDRIVWEEGKMEGPHHNELRLIYKDDQYPLLLKVGQHRIERNILSALVEFRNLLTERPEYQDMTNYMRKKVHLHEARVDNRGFVSIRVTKSEEYPANDEMLDGLAAIFSFYPHVNMETLKGLDRLSIRDILAIYSALLTLAGALKHDLSQEGGEESKKLKRFFIRIKKKELLSYLQSVTMYSKSQIESFLTIVESDLYDTERRIHLWSRPLVKTRDVYFLLLSSLNAPNYLQLIDEWLESANYSLKERGTALEKLMKANLQSYLKGKGKYAVIPEKQKFYANKREYEEIDLIVSMEKMILIIEIKNIKFPMEPRDLHNGYKRLKEGAEQAVRKRDFLLRHRSTFDSELRGIEGKSIHIAVVCNYPHFTGMEIDGVPVIDYMALQSYMNTGEINDMKASFDDNNEFETEVVNQVKLWSNIDEFYDHFEAYLRKPTIVKNLLEKVELKESLITLEKASPQMFIQVVEFKKHGAEL